MYYSTEAQQIASEPTLVDVADPNDALVDWRAIGLGQDEEIDVSITPSPLTIWRVIGYIGGTVGTVAGAYHGYKRARKNKILIALWYGFVGGIFWPVVIPIMFAQGFGKQKTG